MGCRLWGRTELDTTEATWQQQQPSFLEGIQVRRGPLVGSVYQASGVFVSFGCPKAGPPLTFCGLTLHKGAHTPTSLTPALQWSWSGTNDT